MATLTITNSFTPGTTIVSAQMNTNFTDITTFINAQNLDHNNISPSMTPTWTALHTFNGRVILGGTLTTTVPLTLTANSLTTANAFNLTSDSSDATARTLVNILNDNTAATGARCITVTQDSTADALRILTNGNAISLNLSTVSATTANVISIPNADSLTTGGILSGLSNSSDTGTRTLLRFLNDHASATGVTVASFENDSTGENVAILASGVLASGKYGLRIYSNVAQVNSPLAFFHNDHASSTAPVLRLRNDASGDSNTLDIQNSAGSTVTAVKEDGALLLPRLDPPASNEELNANSGASAWAKFDSSPAFEQSYNVGTITKNSTGNYTLTWDFDFGAATYSVVASLQFATDGTKCGVINISGPLTTAVDLLVVQVADSAADQVTLNDGSGCHIAAYGT